MKYYWHRLKLKFWKPSNAWAKVKGSVFGVWENKSPFDYNVVDSFGNVLKVWYFPKAGGTIGKHSHEYGHDCTIARGVVVVTGDREGRNGIPIAAPDTVFFEAGSEHSIKSLVDDVICIHSYPRDVNNCCGR